MYTPLFASNLKTVISNLILTCLPSDKFKFLNILKQWQKDAIFSSTLLEPLIAMADAFVLINCNTQPQQTSQSISSNGPFNSQNHKDSFYLNEYYRGNCTPLRDEPNYYEEYLATTCAARNVQQQGGHYQNSGVYSSYCDKEQFYPNSYSSDIERSSPYGRHPRSPVYYPRMDITPYAYQSSYYDSEFDVKHRNRPHNSKRRSRSRSRSPATSSKRAALPKEMPAPKENHLTLRSTTLWIGYLPESITKQALCEIFLKYGDVHDSVVWYSLLSTTGLTFFCFQIAAAK